jgi:hypothetical protein
MVVEVNIADAEMAGRKAKNRKEWRETGAKFLAISYPLDPPACTAAND